MDNELLQFAAYILEVEWSIQYTVYVTVKIYYNVHQCENQALLGWTAGWMITMHVQPCKTSPVNWRSYQSCKPAYLTVLAIFVALTPFLFRKKNAFFHIFPSQLWLSVCRNVPYFILSPGRQLRCKYMITLNMFQLELILISLQATHVGSCLSMKYATKCSGILTTLGWKFASHVFCLLFLVNFCIAR